MVVVGADGARLADVGRRRSRARRRASSRHTAGRRRAACGAGGAAAPAMTASRRRRGAGPASTSARLPRASPDCGCRRSPGCCRYSLPSRSRCRRSSRPCRSGARRCRGFSGNGSVSVWFCPTRRRAEAAVLVGLALGLLDRRDVGDRRRRASPRVRRGSASRPSSARSRARSFGSSSALRPIAVMLRSLLTIMMSPITRALWLCEVGSSRKICDTMRGFRGSDTSRMRGAELLLVRDVADVGVMARDVDLARARQLETGEAFDVARERRGVLRCIHDSFPGVSCRGGNFTLHPLAGSWVKPAVAAPAADAA